MYTLLELLEQDYTQSPAQLAAQAGMTEAQVKRAARSSAIRPSSTGTG